MWVDFSFDVAIKGQNFKKETRGSMELIKKEVWQKTRNILMAVLGSLILAFGISVFLWPFNLVSGGMSGLAIIIEALLPFDEVITLESINAVLTWVLFFVGFLIFGKEFAAKTFVSAIVYPLGVTLFSQLTHPEVLGGIFCLTSGEYTELPIIIAAITGGALVGIGCSITFLSGGSTGGTDIIALTLCKIFKRLKSSTAIFLTDVTIVLLGVFATKNLIRSLLGVLAAMVLAIVIDKIFLGGNSAFVAQIVTDKGEELNRAIIERADRTSTIFEAKGGYSGKDKKMLTVTFSMRQYTRLMDVVRRVDPDAFVTVWRAHEIRGEGWTWTK